MKTLTYSDALSTQEVFFRIKEYRNGNLAIQMYCADEEYYGQPFATLTKNLTEKKLPNSNLAFVDANMLNKAITFITLNNLGHIKGYVPSGFCVYPLIEFDLEEVKKYAVD